MVKKILLALLVALALLATTAMADVQVIDEANRIDADMEARITEVIEQAEKAHQIDLVVLVTQNVPYDYSESLYLVRSYADDFYDNGGYGMGPDYSGMLYMIDLNNSVQWISTSGVMIDYINDIREEGIMDAAQPHLRTNMGRAALRAMEQTSAYLDQGRMKGSFRYDEATGQRLSGIYNPLEGFEILLAAAGGAVVALIFFCSVNGSYNLKGKTYTYAVDGNADCTLTQDDEIYLRQTVSRVARSTGGSGGSSGSGGRSGSRGSGVHRSSGGRSHGGGGRRF